MEQGSRVQYRVTSDNLHRPRANAALWRASISAWAVEGLTTAVGYGIIKGYPDQTVRPGGSATRAEAVTVIVNTLNVLNGLT